MKKTRRTWKVAAYLLALIVGLAMARTCADVGVDFSVYHGATSRLLHGGPLYSWQLDEMMMFKYPPWWAPFFFPFAPIPSRAAHILWGLSLAALLLILVRWLINHKVRPALICVALVVCYGLFNVFAFTGQVALLMGVGALLLYGDCKKISDPGRKGDARRIMLFWLLSAKILTLVPLFFIWRSYLHKRTWLGLIILLGTLTALVALLDPSHSFPGILQAWLDAIRTRSDPVLGRPSIAIGMREAQSLVSMVYRLFKFDVLNNAVVQVATTGWAVVCTYLFARVSKDCPDLPRWALALAVMTTVQPLTGFYSYVMSVPLLLFALEAGMRHFEKQRDASQVLVAFVGLLMTAAFTQKTLGNLGHWLEFFSVKSWGVYLSAWVVVRNRSLLETTYSGRVAMPACVSSPTLSAF